MSDKFDTDYFGFEHVDYDGKRYYMQVSGLDRWSDVLEDFVRFLESLYKYNIKDQIRIKAPEWLRNTDDEMDWYDPWVNHYFYPNDDDDEQDEEIKPGLDE